MPAAMHLTVLMSLFAVTVCTSNSSTTTQFTKIPTSAAHLTSLAVTNAISSSTLKTSNITQSQPPTIHQITSDKVSSSPPPSTSLQTPNRTEVTHPSPPPQTTNTSETFNETVSHGSTVPAASGSVTATTTVNATSPALSHGWGKGDLEANPGLVAILCIFCIILALVLVVATVKCIRSPRSNFERLDDVPMSKMNEESPFAQYSK